VDQWPGVNHLQARGFFMPLDTQQQTGLGTIIFSDSDGWDHDAYAPRQRVALLGHGDRVCRRGRPPATAQRG
jgi:hypothetical protein